MNKKYVIQFILITLIIGYLTYRYTDLFQRFEPKLSAEKVWVYVELKVELVRDTSDYYYFGQINKSILDKIDKNSSANGLFKLSNIRFWNNDDLLQVYEDDDQPGFRMFKIQDISTLKAYTKDPIFLYENEELDLSAKKLRFKE